MHKIEFSVGTVDSTHFILSAACVCFYWKSYSGCFAVEGFSFSHNQHIRSPPPHPHLLAFVFLINISKSQPVLPSEYSVFVCILVAHLCCECHND